MALINETRAEQFARAYPLLDADLRALYVPVGSYRNYDGSRIALTVRRDIKATGSFGPDGWPCGFVSTGHDSASR